MARLVLVGLPGVGKSVLAERLGTHLACGAVDTDDLVAARVGCAAGEYLRRHGEARFRDTEVAVLADALERPVVVATGAGIVTRAHARRLLRAETTVWLDADVETLLERVGDGDRPLLEGDARRVLERLREERAPWYEAVATVRLDASGEVEVVEERILEAVGG